MTEKMKELEKLVAPIQEWIYSNYDPHTQLVITSTKAELFKAEMAVVNKDTFNRK